MNKEYFSEGYFEMMQQLRRYFPHHSAGTGEPNRILVSHAVSSTLGIKSFHEVTQDQCRRAMKFFDVNRSRLTVLGRMRKVSHELDAHDKVLEKLGLDLSPLTGW